MRKHLSIPGVVLAAVWVAVSTAEGGIPSVGQGSESIITTVPFDDTTGYVLEFPLIFDPAAPSLTKDLISPSVSLPTGTTIPLVETFPLGAGSQPVSDWHEEILTPGWEWGSTLVVSVNGTPIDVADLVVDPASTVTNLAFAFPAVSAPDTLGIEKEITFVGVAGNTTWGDGTLDDGTTPAAEGSIMIREFPTPEPASVALVGLGVLLMRRRH